MLGLIIFIIFVSIVSLIVIIEIRNERKYQEKRKQRRSKYKTTTLKPKKKPVAKPEKKKSLKEKTDVAQKEEEDKKLPICTYPKFTHERLIEMGLSEDESIEFVKELIPQLEIQIPLIEEQLDKEDFQKLERLTHSIKGSATNLGTGGISDLLVEYNTYLKTGSNSAISKVYFEYLKHYTKELRGQYF